MIAGKPLCAWVIEAASQVKEIDEIYVSTEDKEIAQIVKAINPNIKIIDRPPELATDEASTESVMLHFARFVKFDVLITLQATSPLTTPEDIRNGLDKFFSENLNSLLTGVRCKRFFWTEECEPVNYDYKRRPRRQDFKGWIMENGAFYITDYETLIKNKCRLGGKIGILEMSPINAFEIDEPDDWDIVEFLLIRRRERSFEKTLSNIKLLVVDVDGTLTDGGMYYSKDGEILKKFNTRDAKGLEILRNLGIDVAIMTSENSPIVLARAKKLNIKHAYINVRDKLSLLKELCNKLGLRLDEVAYIGDDVNDIQCMSSVGFSACPIDSVEEVKKVVHYICKCKGGAGAVREICDLIVSSINNSKGDA